MLASINGSIKLVRENFLVIDTASGLGYKIFVTNNVSSRSSLGENISLYVFHNINENSQSLFGFSTYDEQEFFELLLSISGIGPKVALGVLNAASINEIREAVLSNTPEVLTNISGIGKKTAERIVLELKSKISISDIRPVGTKSDDLGNNSNIDVYQALIQLGYNTVEARAAIKMISPNVTDLDKKLKEALKNLGK